jgi:hypothetical protein
MNMLERQTRSRNCPKLVADMRIELLSREFTMKSLPVAFSLALALACSAGPVCAYTITTYHGAGASRIEACALATQTAESPDEEPAHGRLLKTGACQCDHNGKGESAGAWQCMVEATHER